MHTEPLAPGKRDPEGRRRAILGAATEIIVTRGAAALTHRAVASHAGVSLGSTTQYFSSIEELREDALRELAEEDDAALAALEPHLATLRTDPTGAVTELLSYLQDRRAVNADIALFSSAMTDPSLRQLALRWSDKLIEMLLPHIERDRAEAIAVYIDGATIHAGLRQQPLSREALTVALTSLAGTATSFQPTSTTGHPSEKSES